MHQIRRDWKWNHVLRLVCSLRLLSFFLGSWFHSLHNSTHFITRRIRVFLVFPSRSSFSHSFPFEWKESSEWWENEGSTRRTRKKQWSEIRIPLPLVWVPFNKKKQDMRWTVDYSTNLWLMFPFSRRVERY